MNAETIPFNRAQFLGREYEYMLRAVNEGHISGNGSFTREAERLLGQIHGLGQALLTTSCTHALEVSAKLIDFAPGDEVIVPAYTFVSTAAAFLLHGAKPRFVDVLETTLNISPEEVRRAIGPRTRAICIVHYGGVAADPDVFREIADEFGLILIEDNAHGLGGYCKGRPLGTFGEFSTLSFHETKNISCGEGGALQVNEERFLERAEILREKGTDRSRYFRGQVDKYTWVDVGSSWVMSDILAAMLVAQLERFSEIQESRMKVWTEYESQIGTWANANEVLMPFIPGDCQHTAHMFQLRFRDLSTRTRFIEHLKCRGILAVFHYQPLHLSVVGRELGGHEGQCPVTELAADTLVRLPLFSAMTPTQVARVVEAVTSFQP